MTNIRFKVRLFLNTKWAPFNVILKMARLFFCLKCYFQRIYIMLTLNEFVEIHVTSTYLLVSCFGLFIVLGSNVHKFRIRLKID